MSKNPLTKTYSPTVSSVKPPFLLDVMLVIQSTLSKLPVICCVQGFRESHQTKQTDKGVEAVKGLMLP